LVSAWRGRWLIRRVAQKTDAAAAAEGCRVKIFLNPEKACVHRFRRFSQIELRFFRINKLQQDNKMKKDFWLQRWAREETGFHENGVNAYLMQFWHNMHLAHDSAVFVPLCGKSADLQWLRGQGHPVLGVELSHIAVQAFFRENGYSPNVVSSGKFDHYEANDISILCGDFFDLGRDEMAAVKAVYDRAAMVALPPEMRGRYVRHLLGILPPAAQILLVTFDYPQAEMQGPPFALPSTEVEALYRGHAEIRLLDKIDVLAENPRFQKRGLTRLQESIYLLSLH
jgi:thiopurine S-methyltransferase